MAKRAKRPKTDGNEPEQGQQVPMQTGEHHVAQGPEHTGGQPAELQHGLPNGPHLGQEQHLSHSAMLTAPHMANIQMQMALQQQGQDLQNQGLGPQALMAIQQQADPSEAPPPKRRRRPKSKKLPDTTPGHVQDETGKLIPIPAKHGTPVKHSRPRKSVVARKSTLGEEEPNMLIRIHLRRFEGDAEAEGDQLPSATVHAHPSMTLEALRQKIHSFCPSLPAKAQQFFKKIEGDQYQRVDSSSRYSKSLKSAGFDEPGPHDIWIEIDLAELFKPQNASEGEPLRIEGPPPDAEAAGPSQNHALQTPEFQGEQGDGQFGNGEGQIVRSPGPGSILPEAAPMHHRSMNKRSNKKWTEEEVEHLLLGLMKFGTSSWTTIAKTWRFDDRTTVDLKDKWRNLVKNVRDGRVMRGMVLSEPAKAKVWRIIHENGIEPTPQNQRLHVQVVDPNAQQLAVSEGIGQIPLSEILDQNMTPNMAQNPNLGQNQDLQQNLPEQNLQPNPELQQPQNEGMGMA